MRPRLGGGGGLSHPSSLRFRGQLSLISKITETVIPTRFLIDNLIQLNDLYHSFGFTFKPSNPTIVKNTVLSLPSAKAMGWDN